MPTILSLLFIAILTSQCGQSSSFSVPESSGQQLQISLEKNRPEINKTFDYFINRRKERFLRTSEIKQLTEKLNLNLFINNLDTRLFTETQTIETYSWKEQSLLSQIKNNESPILLQKLSLWFGTKKVSDQWTAPKGLVVITHGGSPEEILEHPLSLSHPPKQRLLEGNQAEKNFTKTSPASIQNFRKVLLLRNAKIEISQDTLNENMLWLAQWQIQRMSQVTSHHFSSFTQRLATLRDQLAKHEEQPEGLSLEKLLEFKTSILSEISL